jgi:hypothetical protein
MRSQMRVVTVLHHVFRSIHEVVVVSRGLVQCIQVLQFISLKQVRVVVNVLGCMFNTCMVLQSGTLSGGPRHIQLNQCRLLLHCLIFVQIWLGGTSLFKMACVASAS